MHICITHMEHTCHSYVPVPTVLVIAFKLPIFYHKTVLKLSGYNESVMINFCRTESMDTCVLVLMVLEKLNVK